jgi:hypothetical protein
MRALLLTLLIGAVSLCAGAHAAGVAFITDLQGDATLDGVRVALMTEVSEGQKLSVPAKGSVAVMYVQSGDEFALTGGGEYAVGKTSITATKDGGVVKRGTQWRPDLTRVVDISKSATASLRMRSLAPPAPSVTSAQLIYPVGGKIASLQPELRWTRVASASEYDVSVTLEDRIVYRGKVKADVLKLPVKLTVGRQYTWMVTAGEARVAAQFSTLSADEMKRLAALKPGSRATFSDHLLYAITLHGMDATQDAKAAWQVLAVQRPELTELAALAK